MNRLKLYEYFKYLLNQMLHLNDKQEDYIGDLILWSDTLPENSKKPKDDFTAVFEQQFLTTGQMVYHLPDGVVDFYAVFDIIFNLLDIKLTIEKTFVQTKS